MFQRLIIALTLALTFAGAARAAPGKVTYAEHVRPIFQQHCFACHGQDVRKSDLALDTFDDAIAGGAGGEVILASDLESSRLWALVNHDDSPKMPPEQDKIPAEQLAVIKSWIEGGALKDAGSKAPPKVMVETVAPTNDENRPAGEPAMPAGVLQEPVVYSEQPAAADAVATSPWAPLVAVGGVQQVALYQPHSGELLGVLPYPEGMPRVVRFSRDGAWLLVGGGQPGASGNVALFDVVSGFRLATLGEETDAVLAADVSPDRSLVALGGPKRTVRVYRVADQTLAYEIKKHTDWATAIEFSPDGKLLATADRTGAIHLWDAQRGLGRGDLRGHQQRVTAVSWRADSKALASASDDGSVRIWQPDGKAIKNWQAHAGGVLAMALARDGRLATAGRDGAVKLWQGDGKPIRDLAKFAEAALAARITSDGEHVVAGDWLGNVPVISIESGETLRQLPPNPATLAMRYAAAAEQLESSAQQQAAADDALAAADAALAKAKQAQEQAAKEREESALQHAAAQQTHAKVQALLDDYRRAAAELTAASEQHRAESEAADAQLAAANATYAALQQQAAEHRTQLEKLAQQLAEIKAEHDRLTAAGAELAAQAAAQAEEVTAAEERLMAKRQAAAEAKRAEIERAEALRK